MQEYYRSGNYSLLEDIPFKEMFGRKSRVYFAEYLLECYLNVTTGYLKGKCHVR